MTEPLAFIHGRTIPASQLAIPVWDAGFVQGVTVAEQMRTFGGHLFRMDQHLERLANSLDVIGVELGTSLDELASVARDLAAHNHRLLVPGDDLGLSLFVTPGPYAAFAPADAQGAQKNPQGATIGMHTYPVWFASYVDKYEHGQRLHVTSVRQVPGNCWPASLKCRSRIHYYLADREARQHDGASRALLLDQEGFVSEASSASFVMFRADSGFVSPPREKILPGVSVAVLEELAQRLEVPFQFHDLTLDDVLAADEAFLCSTSPCLLPVSAINGRAIGGGSPGEMFRRVLAAWNHIVGLDIVDQARRFKNR